MISTIHLIFDRNGVQRLAKSDRFELQRGEKVVKVSVTIPDHIFKPAPELTASLTVAPEQVGEAEAIVLDPTLSAGEIHRGDVAQGRLNVMAAQLLERAINSTDRTIATFALDALAVCRESGVVVRIDVPEPTTGEAQ